MRKLKICMGTLAQFRHHNQTTNQPPEISLRPHSFLLLLPSFFWYYNSFSHFLGHHTLSPTQNKANDESHNSTLLTYQNSNPKVWTEFLMLPYRQQLRFFFFKFGYNLPILPVNYEESRRKVGIEFVWVNHWTIWGTFHL